MLHPTSVGGPGIDDIGRASVDETPFPRSSRVTVALADLRTLAAHAWPPVRHLICSSTDSRIGCLIWSPPHEPFGQGRDGRDQFGGIDRLCQMDLKPCSQGFDAILGSRIRRQRRGWHLSDAGIVMPPDAIDELEAVHVRHAQIGDHDIGDFGLQASSSASAADRAVVDARAGRFKDLGHQRRASASSSTASTDTSRRSATGDPPSARGRSWMDPRDVLADRMNDHQRDLHPERRALIEAAAGRFDRAAVHLRQLAGDRQDPDRARLALARCRHPPGGIARTRAEGIRARSRCRCR